MPVSSSTPTPIIKMLTEDLRSRILAYLPRYPSKQAATLPALHLVQEHFRCVPHQAIAEIAELLELTPAEVHDSMSFYGFFSQAPLGAKRVWICRSISCALRGGEGVLDDACRKLSIHPGETTADGELTVEFAECLGICDHAPAALVDDGRIFGPLDDQNLDSFLNAIKPPAAKS